MLETTKNSLEIKATQEEIYNAITNPRALEIWQTPGEMTAKVHNFELRIGGGYEMSLFYPENENKMTGKTREKEDKFIARFIELIPNKKIVLAINFDTLNPDFSAEMIMEVLLNPTDTGTNVTFTFKNIPIGIKPEDNEKGTRSSLNKLSNYLKQKNELKEGDILK